MPIASSKVSFCPHSPPSPLPTSTYPLNPLSLWLTPHCCLCIPAVVVFLNTFTFFHLSFQTLSPLTAFWSAIHSFIHSFLSSVKRHLLSIYCIASTDLVTAFEDHKVHWEKKTFNQVIPTKNCWERQSPAAVFQSPLNHVRMGLGPGILPYKR